MNINWPWVCTGTANGYEHLSCYIGFIFEQHSLTVPRKNLLLVHEVCPDANADPTNLHLLIYCHFQVLIGKCLYLL